MNQFHKIVKKARTWATQMGYEGEQHRDEVKKYVDAELENL